MSVITHLVEEMYEHLETINDDIDRLAMARDRMKAAILALCPDGTVPSTESPRPGVREPKPAPPRNRVGLDVAKPLPKKPRKAQSFAGATGTTSGRPPKYDYAQVSTVAMAAFVDGRPMAKAVAAVFDVSDGMGNWLIGAARKAGHPIPKRGGKPSDAITPAEIRHEVEAIPVGEQLAPRDIHEPIAEPHGFAGRPTHVEHPPIETERNGWRPGMGAEILAVVNGG